MDNLTCKLQADLQIHAGARVVVTVLCISDLQ